MQFLALLMSLFVALAAAATTTLTVTSTLTSTFTSTCTILLAKSSTYSNTTTWEATPSAVYVTLQVSPIAASASATGAVGTGSPVMPTGSYHVSPPAASYTGAASATSPQIAAALVAGLGAALMAF